MAKPTLSRTSMTIISGIGTLIIVVCALVLPGILIKQHPIVPYRPIGGPASETPNSSDSSSAQFTTSYSSSNDHFTVRFPSYPKVKASTIPVGGVSVPANDYSVSTDNSSYSVNVVTYPPSFDMSDKDARLKDALNGAAKSINATIETSKLDIFAGNRSLQATLRVTHGNNTWHNYVLYVIKGNTLYSLIAINSTQNDFGAFKQTFRVIN